MSELRRRTFAGSWNPRTDVHVAFDAARFGHLSEERKRFDRRQDDLISDIGQAKGLMKPDLDDRRDGIDEAITLFGKYTRLFYGVPGKLGVDVGRDGDQFTFAIDRIGSDGVD